MDNQSNSEQINLVEYINVILKRRKIIFWCLAIGVVLAVLIYVIKTKPNTVPVSPAVYESEAIIEVGTIHGQPVEKIDNLTAKINAGLYSNSLAITATHLGTSLVSLKTSSQNQEKTKTILSGSVNKILLEHDRILKTYKNDVSKKIADLEYSINKFISVGQQAAALAIAAFNSKDDLANASPTKTVKEPVTSVLKLASHSDSVSPGRQSLKSILFMVIAGAIAGVIIGLTISFGREWWDKNKANIKFY